MCLCLRSFSFAMADLESWVYLSSEVSIPRVGFGSCGLQNTQLMTCEALKNGVKLIDSAQARGSTTCRTYYKN